MADQPTGWGYKGAFSGLGAQPPGKWDDPEAAAFFQSVVGMTPDEWSMLKDVNKYAAKGVSYFSAALKPFFEKAETQTDLMGQQAIGATQQAVGGIGQAYRNARAGIAGQQRTAQQGILDAQSKAMAGAQQSAIDAGLSGSTAQTAMGRSITADTQRALGNLGATIGQMYAGLDIGEQQAMQGAAGQLASVLGNQQAMQQNLASLAFGGINQTPITAPSSSGSGLGGLLGGVGGLIGGLGALGGTGGLAGLLAL